MSYYYLNKFIVVYLYLNHLIKKLKKWFKNIINIKIKYIILLLILKYIEYNLYLNNLFIFVSIFIQKISLKEFFIFIKILKQLKKYEKINEYKINIIHYFIIYKLYVSIKISFYVF